MSEKINRDDEILGQRLQTYREQAGVTQQAMADACGLSKNYISAIERGVHKCNAKTFITYGRLCNVSLINTAFTKRLSICYNKSIMKGGAE